MSAKSDKQPSRTSIFLWNDLPWLAWNGFLLTGIYQLSTKGEIRPIFLILRLLLGTAIVKALPPGHLSAFPYSGHLILVALIQYGAWRWGCAR